MEFVEPGESGFGKFAVRISGAGASRSCSQAGSRHCDELCAGSPQFLVFSGTLPAYSANF